ncbi:MAG: hypothetical protein K9J38_00585 [Polynucleobacter sp.]|nr:hypothetical protein [Polynucleobacter sp.]
MKILIFILILFCSKTYGLRLDEVDVFGEKIDSCGLSSESVTASLASAMRYNKIPMVRSIDAITLYHAVTALEMGNSCSANLYISFYIYEPKIFVPTIKRNLSADVVLCKKNMLLVGPKHDLQRRINDGAKELAEQCLLTIDKK